MRRLWLTLSVLSLLGVLLTAAAWIDSRNFRIVVLLGSLNVVSRDGAVIILHWYGLDEYDIHRWSETPSNGVPSESGVMGFDFVSDAPNGRVFWQLEIPHYFILVLQLGLMFGFQWLSRRLRVFPAGHCQRCGYDMRATPEKCPECGQQKSPTP